jgi:hypothetical protein
MLEPMEGTPMKHPRAITPRSVRIACLSAAYGVITLSGRASAQVQPLDPAYVEPAPNQTATCDLLDPAGLPAVFIASGDVDGLHEAAAIGGLYIRLERGGYWPLTHTLYVAPETVIFGDPYWMPLLEAVDPMEAVVQVTSKNRLEAVWIAGQMQNGQYGVMARPWLDKKGVFHRTENIQISGTFIEEVGTYAFTAHDGSCFQVYNTKMTNAGNCFKGKPGGGLMDLRGIQLMDVDQVAMVYANAFGLRGIDVRRFLGTNLAVHDIASQSAISNACGSPEPKHRGVGIELGASASYGSDAIRLKGAYVSEVTGTGLSATDVELDASLDFITLSLFAQQNGAAENAVVSSKNATACIGEAGSTAPLSLLTCGQVDVLCPDGIQPTNVCP